MDINKITIPLLRVTTKPIVELFELPISPLAWSLMVTTMAHMFIMQLTCGFKIYISLYHHRRGTFMHRKNLQCKISQSYLMNHHWMIILENFNGANSFYVYFLFFWNSFSFMVEHQETSQCIALDLDIRHCMLDILYVLIGRPPNALSWT